MFYNFKINFIALCFGANVANYKCCTSYWMLYSIATWSFIVTWKCIKTGFNDSVVPVSGDSEAQIHINQPIWSDHQDFNETLELKSECHSGRYFCFQKIESVTVKENLLSAIISSNLPWGRNNFYLSITYFKKGKNKHFIIHR